MTQTRVDRLLPSPQRRREEIRRYPEQAEESDLQAGFVKGCIDGYVRAANAFGLIDGDMLGDYVANELDEVPREFENLLPRSEDG